ncbi:MAG TPA: hypothetical protein PKO06_02305, partial [Candidatus Ozemobacteraceae bacterium]|nr:hypothetical protein [Candidatus Ozemobacteraceae bacterium]
RHLDGRTIPASLTRPASGPVRVHAGDPLGQVVPWIASVTPEQRRYDHIHLEVVDWQGHFLNPNQFLPRPTDTLPPVIQQLWLLPNGSDNPFRVEEPEKLPVVHGTIDLVIDTYDQLDGSLYRHVPYEVTWKIEAASPTPPVEFPERVAYRFDRIPRADDRTVFADTFFQARIKGEPTVITCEGNNVGRRFLLHLAHGDVTSGYDAARGFDTRSLADGRYVLVVTVRDIDGNATSKRETFEVRQVGSR